MKIVFPEFDNPNIKAALSLSHSVHPSIEAIPAQNLTAACELIKSGAADAMIAGVDYSSRDVILACRDYFGMARKPQLFPQLKVEADSISDNSTSSELYSTFSGLAIMQKTATQETAAQKAVTQETSQAASSTSDQIYLLADMAACKHPTKTQLIEIILQTYSSAKSLLRDEPRIALLSFSTLGSGGRDDFITLAQEIVPLFRNQGILIDGEMQLDAAVNPVVGQKKAPDSPVAGRANVLIAPDLNAGNILYKAFEQFGGFTVAGPILQGFNVPVSDLSRGSTPMDIALTIETIAHLAEQKQA